MSFPELEWFDAQEESEVDLNVLQAKTAVALPKIVASEVGPGQTDLRELSEVEITLISDDEIAAAHGQFMDDPTPTDVITFQHGSFSLAQIPRRGRLLKGIGRSSESFCSTRFMVFFTFMATSMQILRKESRCIIGKMRLLMRSARLTAANVQHHPVSASRAAFAA